MSGLVAWPDSSLEGLLLVTWSESSLGARGLMCSLHKVSSEDDNTTPDHGRVGTVDFSSNRRHHTY